MQPGSHPYWLLRLDRECAGGWYFPLKRLGRIPGSLDPWISGAGQVAVLYQQDESYRCFTRPRKKSAS